MLLRTVEDLVDHVPSVGRPRERGHVLVARRSVIESALSRAVRAHHVERDARIRFARERVALLFHRVVGNG